MKKGRVILTGILLVFLIALSGCSATVSGRTIRMDEMESPVVETFGSEDGYAYQMLPDRLKACYRNVEKIIAAMGTEVILDRDTMADCSEDELGLVFRACIADHPEFFYVDGYTYTKYTRGNRLVDFAFSGNYTMDRDKVIRRWQEISERAETFLAGAQTLTDEYSKVKYVYENLIKQTEYVSDSSDNQNVYSVIVNHESVCLGYAKATQLYLRRLGMECMVVQGMTRDSVAHAWNLVKIDGDYYYLDTTWGDASYQMETGSVQPEINYDYLNVTTAELEKTHKAEDFLSLPNCVSRRANYFYREGALFYEPDREQLRNLFQASDISGKTEVSLKCESLQTFVDIKSILLDERKIFEYWGKQSETLTYAVNEDQLTITFWMTNYE